MSGALVLERTRALIRVTGRDPVGMIQGLATADIERVTADRGVYTVFLTPKGRMVADARVFRVEEGLLLDTAADAAEPLQAHLKKFVPPLFAKGEDVSGAWAVVGVYGPEADEIVGTATSAGEFGGAAGEADTVAAGEEEAVVPLGNGFRVRTHVTGDPGWDLFVPADQGEKLVESLLAAGGRPADPNVVDALRVAAGRPRWGRELTSDVIPLEAGLLDRAISQGKGCYTGQEVIVRILHRGHVNRHLRRLEFAGPLPEPGTELFEDGNEKARGVVTSAVENEAGAFGLGYVRREVEPPAELHVGSPAGDRVRVTPLD